MADYIVVDFDGQIKWTQLPSGEYAVDQQYLDFFLKEIRAQQ